MSDGQTHETIWLQPWCDGCERNCSSGEGRMWCQDNVWDQCDECERRPVQYILARKLRKPSPQEIVERSDG